MDDITKRLTDASQCGVYELILRPEDVEGAARDAGLTVFRIDIRKMRDKKDFLDQIAKTLQFPEWFGNNWDALNDCLTDLEWLPSTRGYVLVFEHSEHFGSRHAQEFENAIVVFQAASEFWKTQGRPFWTFIATSAEWNSRLQKWPS
jgi:RNAse (barnase) inhibitor barstar